MLKRNKSGAIRTTRIEIDGVNIWIATHPFTPQHAHALAQCWETTQKAAARHKAAEAKSAGLEPDPADLTIPDEEFYNRTDKARAIESQAFAESLETAESIYDNVVQAFVTNWDLPRIREDGLTWFAEDRMPAEREKYPRCTPQHKRALCMGRKADLVWAVLKHVNQR